MSRLGLVALLLFSGQPLLAATLDVRLTYASQPGFESFTGRVFVVVSPKEMGDRVFSQSWFTPSPFFAQIVRGWTVQSVLEFTPEYAFPHAWGELPEGEHFVQAILDRDLGGQNPLTSPGNLFSKSRKVKVEAGKPLRLELRLDQVVPTKKFVETERVKSFERESKLLSDFLGKSIRMRAGIVLPKSYAQHPERYYPIIYEVPGFGGDHFLAFAEAMRNGKDVAGVEMIHVILDPACRRGHHVFADSANNGPVGRAFTEEFLPALEAAFRVKNKPGTRFLTGHSSGGWSSLWLQITYPELFGGVWSTAPDPVDFRDFQRVDIYQPGINLFRDSSGALRPLARKDGKTAFTYKRFSDMEVVFGRGGQLFSFEAVFSPRGPDGEPAQLWDRQTGAIDREVAAAWRKYDLRQILEGNWEKLGPKLADKIHVFMGEEDTYLLDGAVRLLRESLMKLGSDAVVELVPGRHHGNLVDANLRKRIAGEMANASRK